MATASTIGTGSNANSQPEAILVTLSHFGLLRFSGEDARQFLHSQLSCDVNGLEAGQARYGSYNTAQGRMLASFLLWRHGAEYVMQLPHSLCGPVCKRLAMYILRSKVIASDISETHVLLGLAGAPAAQLLATVFAQIPDRPLSLIQAEDAGVLRLDDDRFEIVASPARTESIRAELAIRAMAVDTAVWDRTNILAGIPYITPATQEQFVPQMANLDLIGGVSFDKGCYPGQEIVARMHYLGKLKQRMYLAKITDGDAPQAGDKLYSPTLGEQAVGMIMNAAPCPDGGHDVLAVMQIASAGGNDVHCKALAGSKLQFRELPYKLAP
jgi:tRNA-modifying protein YgfZ